MVLDEDDMDWGSVVTRKYTDDVGRVRSHVSVSDGRAGR